MKVRGAVILGLASVSSGCYWFFQFRAGTGIVRTFSPGTWMKCFHIERLAVETRVRGELRRSVRSGSGGGGTVRMMKRS